MPNTPTTMATARATAHQLLINNLPDWPATVAAANSHAHIAQAERALARAIVVQDSRARANRPAAFDAKLAAANDAPPSTNE